MVDDEFLKKTNISMPENDIYTQTSFQNQVNRGHEPDSIKQSVVEELYNTDKRINTLIQAWAGRIEKDNQKRALAGARFLNKQLGALKGVINTTNAFTKKNAEETKAILHAANRAFIYDMVNDPTIQEEDYRTLSKTYEHALELFLGLPTNGHGANVLRDALAGLNTQIPETEKPKSLLDLGRLK